MDRDIEFSTAASSGASPRQTESRTPAGSPLLRLAVVVAAALPLLALVTWVTVGSMRGGREVPPFALSSHTRVAAVPAAPRAFVARKPAPSVDAFVLESQMSAAQLINRWNRDITKASARFGVPKSWIRAVMLAESGGRTMSAKDRPITSIAGAVGVMQMMPETYAEMRAENGLGRDPYEPHDNIVAAAAYLRWLYVRYGYPTMFAAYNDGPGNLEERLVEGRMLPPETQLYVASVTGNGAIAPAGGARSLVRLTRPNGTEVAINGFAVNSVRAPLPGEYAAGVNAVIGMGKLRQGVRETVAQATIAVRRHGGRV